MKKSSYTTLPAECKPIRSRGTLLRTRQRPAGLVYTQRFFYVGDMLSCRHEDHKFDDLLDGDIAGRCRQATAGPSGGHGAKEDSAVGRELVHTDAVTEESTAGEGRRGVDGDDAYPLILIEEVVSQTIHES